MGTAERAGWEDVANDLLRTCHINVRLESLSECDAGVFVALYEAILGEKVPDYIAEARSQEDDIHNVQSVVDSLALDYLQISLSHITGENIVRGDKESIRNLLEIFEGLLEYLTEQQSEDEELSDGGESESPGRSDRCSLASWNDSESTADLIRLGDTAHAVVVEELDEPLSRCSQRNRRAEQELHDMSEKLSRRLEELDLMLKRVLDDSGQTSQLKEEDKRSHHSDSVMECRRPKQQKGVTLGLISRMCDFHLRYPIVMHIVMPLCATRGAGASQSSACLNLLLLLSAVKVKENNLLPVLLEEFPPLPLSSHGLGSMWKQQMQQLDRLNAPDNRRGRIKLASEVEEAQRRHDLLVDIIRKEQEHNRRLRDFRERVQQQKSSQNRLREQRQQVARARKYHSDYHTQLRARLMKARTREERIFKQIFEEGLELQKARLREQRAYAKEQRQEHQRRHRDQLQAMENYYRDQFLLLAETLAQEREEIQVRKKVQEKALLKLKRDLRSRMEREIGELQRIIVQNDEDDYFCTLEAERLRSRMHAASFHYGTSCLP
uniref:DUF5745 domain-containing protein n=1 Tax=Denticeps clupeoides TaxID=299321 RepID=A0AAY4A711_9TELE